MSELKCQVCGQEAQYRVNGKTLFCERCYSHFHPEKKETDLIDVAITGGAFALGFGIVDSILDNIKL